MSLKSSLDLEPSPRQFEFIVVEGIDGCGKTTVSELLAQQIGAVSFHTPPPAFDLLRGVIEESNNVVSKFLFYLCSVAFTSTLIRQARRTSHVVCDRYIASTFAYHRALGLNIEWDIELLALEAPSYTVFLFVSDEEERLRRVQARPIRTASDELLNSTQLRKKVMEEFRRFRMIEMDTSNIDAEQVVAQIRKKIGI